MSISKAVFYTTIILVVIINAGFLFYYSYLMPLHIDEAGWWKCGRWERPDEAEERARGAAALLVSRFGDSPARVAVITHGMFKPILVSALLGRPFIGNEWLGDLYNTSVTQLELSAGGVRLESYNDTSHLCDGGSDDLLSA